MTLCFADFVWLQRKAAFLHEPKNPFLAHQDAFFTA